MDDDIFSTSDMNIKRWVNEMLRTTSPSSSSLSSASSSQSPFKASPQQQRVSDASTHAVQQQLLKLQGMSSDKSLTLETLAEESLSSIPKVLLQVEDLRTKSEEVGREIAEFEKELSIVEQRALPNSRKDEQLFLNVNESADPILQLVEIDRLRTSLQKTIHAVENAQELQTADQEIELALQKGDVMDLGQRIQDMRNSLQAVKELPQFRGQAERLESVQNQMEAMARKHIIQALKRHDVQTTKAYMEVFTKLGREGSLLEWYSSQRAKPLHELWSSYEELTTNVVDGSGEARRFSEWLNTFFQQFQSLVAEEVEFASAVFPRASPAVSMLVLQFLRSITESFQQRINNCVDRTRSATGKGILPLIPPYQMSLSFISSVLTLLRDKTSESYADIAYETLLPFRNAQQNAAQWHRHCMEMKTREFGEKLNATKDLLEMVGEMEGIGSSFVTLLEESSDRLINFSTALEFESILQVLSDLVLKFIKYLRDVLEKAKKQTGEGAGMEKLSSDYDEAKTAISSQNWDPIAASLNMLIFCSSFAERMTIFDRKLKQTFQKSCEELIGSQFAQLLSRDVSSFRCDAFSSSYDSPFLCKDAQLAEKVLSFARQLSDVSYNLLLEPSERLQTLSSDVQTFVFDSMFMFIRVRLSSVPSMPQWSAAEQRHPGGLDLPTFSAGPSPYVIQIGDHILGLPQQLEPFASVASEALCAPTMTIASSLAAGDVMSQDLTDLMDSKGTQSDATEDTTAEGFVFQWLTAVARATTSLYLQRILEIPKLSSVGEKQLVSDVKYLSNVLSQALGMEEDRSLAILQRLLEADSAEFEYILRDSKDVAEKRMANVISSMRNA